MAVFKYVTRGEQTAQGKQKAYFCAHPDDYGRYFEKITNEILDTLAKENNRNCAFFYLEDATAERDDDFKFSFKEMNLIVMPVTTKLLTTANPALDIEFRLAAEYGIPVLPIMMESGLDDVFNAKCGDIQYLDPNSRDATAISYEEKLTKYLTSVLIGDELAEKIRKAFDAYIFLSYRKKDRKYAQELMRLIHKNEFCRDIAIWYDEFLTPGEDFNKSIEDALNKSKLFALAVTPNLVNEENYIMKVEYPMAKKADKTILPAELVETDKTALSEKYDGIPECISSDDESELSAYLENALEGIALRENDTDPEHNFFIGLAYLGGVDVEKDNERAIKLITSAAEASLPEAMEKLVSIYRKGEAGEKDYEKAIEWQRKLVECKKKIYTKKQDKLSAIAYIDSIGYLGDYIYELRRIDETEKVYLTMLAVSEEVHGRFNENWSRRAFVLTFNNLGNILKTRGDLDGAEKYYFRMLEICKELERETKTVLARRDLANSYANRGEIYEARGDLISAEDYYLKALELCKKIAQETNTIESRRDLLLNFIRLGDNRKARGNIDVLVAEDYYYRAFVICEELVQVANAIELRSDLSICYEKLGDICKSRGKIEKAEEYFRKSLGIDEKLASETGTIESRRDLSVSYNNLGDICESRGKLEAAEEYYRKSLGIREKLANETGTVESLRDLSISYERLGDICKSRGNLREAEEYYRKSLGIAEKLASKTGTVESYDDLAVSYYNMAFVSSNEKTNYLNKALNIWTQLADLIPDVPKYARRRDIVKHELGIN